MRREDYQEYAAEIKSEQVPIVLTAAEAMDILGVGKNTIYQLLNCGQLKGVRVGRCWRVPLKALEDYVFVR